jgi:hypothetical protein
MELYGQSFGTVVKMIFNHAMVQFALALLAADVLSGLAISLYQKQFKLGASADFLWSRALPYFLGAGALQLVVMTIPPSYPIGGVDSALTSVIWGFVVAALLGQLLDNLRQMGLPIPEIMTAKKVPETKTTLGILIAIGMSAMMVGCAGNGGPQISPERRVALYGIQVSKYLAEVKTSADNMFKEQVLPEPQYRVVLQGLVKANAAGEKLGVALAAYDAATGDRKDIVNQIDAALITLSAALPDLVPFGVTDAARLRLNKGVAEVQRLMLTIARFTAPTGAWLRGTGAVYATS